MSAPDDQLIRRKFAAICAVRDALQESGDFGNLLTRLVDAIVDHFQVDAASLCLRDAETGEATFRVVRGPKGDRVKELRLQPGEGIVGWVIEHGEPAFAPCAREDERFFEGVDRITGYETRSVMCAPLAMDGDVIGAVELINPLERDCFTEDDLDVFATLVDHCVVYVNNARLVAWARRKVEELTTLVEVEEWMDSTLDLDRLLSLIIEGAVRVADAEAGSLLLLDDRAGDLYFQVATGAKAREVKQYRVAMGEGVAGWVAQRGEPLLVRDVTKEPRFDPSIAKSVGFETHSLVAVPMKIHGRVLGVVEMVNITPYIANESEYLEVLVGLASQAASAIERARLYQRLEEKIDLANEELRQANRRLRVEKQRVEAMIASMADGVLVTDADGVIVLSNPAVHRLLEVEPEDVDGRSLHEVQACDPLRETFAESASSGETCTIPDWETPGGRTVRVLVSPVTDERGQLFGSVAVLTDISDLNELSRMKSDLVSIVSHELRAPLTAMKAIAITLLHGATLDETTETEFLEIINSQCDRLSRMIGNLLDVSRIESGKALTMLWRAVDLPAMAQEVLETMSAYGDGHELRVETIGKTGALHADPDKLQQILTNLTDNAIKYSPDGGEVIIRIEPHPEHVDIAVIDHGLGIPADEVPHLFEMYRRAKGQATQRASGTGIGLHLTKCLVEAHGGTITVESEEGRGTTFHIQLPRNLHTEIAPL